MLFYDGNAKRPLRMVGYPSPERFGVSLDYLIGRHYDTESFRDYVKRLETKTMVTSTGAELRNDPLLQQRALP